MYGLWETRAISTPLIEKLGAPGFEPGFWLPKAILSQMTTTTFRYTGGFFWRDREGSSTPNRGAVKL